MQKPAKGKGRVAKATLFFCRAALLAALASTLLSTSAAGTQQKATAKKPAAGRQTPAQPAAKKASTKTSTKKNTKRKATSARRRGQKAPTADRVKEIQGALARAGHFSGEPTGKWDAASVGAMKSFQGTHGLKATGKIDAASLQKLGLGSHTAGQAAPRPSASAAEGAARNR